MKLENHLLSKEVSDYEKEKKAFEFTSQLKKQSLINELKNGLGEEIKKNPKPIINTEAKKHSVRRFLAKLSSMFK